MKNQEYEPTDIGLAWLILSGLSGAAFFAALVVTGTGLGGESKVSMEGFAVALLAVVGMGAVDARQDTFAYFVLFVFITVFAHDAWTGGLTL